MNTQKPSIGRIVNYVGNDTYGNPVVMPAIIVHVFDEDEVSVKDVISVQSFGRGQNCIKFHDIVRHVEREPGKPLALNSWHWPNRY